MTLRQSLDTSVGVLVLAGFTPEDARRDGSVLIRHCLGWSMAEWAARNRDAAPEGLHDRLMSLARRRARREPVAYLTGAREFYGREFRVSPAVLIPRPGTEGIIEETLRILAGSGASGTPGAGLVIVDVGTGSGCIAITLALECPSARIVATDTSREALDAARHNARALGAGRVEFVEAWLLPASPSAPDIIVSNPPYVPEADRASLPEDVRDFEPATALFAGEEGLDVIRALVPAAARRLAPQGWLIMEIGASQADAVSALVRESGLVLHHVREDLQGIPRIVVAQRLVAS